MTKLSDVFCNVDGFFGYRDGAKVEMLIGETVLSIEYTDGCETVVLETDGATYWFASEGDCCSHSYFQAFDNREDLIGQKLIGLEARIEGKERDLEQEEGISSGEVSLYGLVFKTAKGSAYLELRNDSNGYYGGWVNLHREAR